MQNIDKQITWINSKGNTIVVTATLQIITETYSDDWLGEVQGPTSTRIRFSATCDGKALQVGMCVPERTTLPGFYGCVGQAGMQQDAYESLLAAVAELKAHPAVVAEKLANDKAYAMHTELERNRRNLRNTMTLNGRSF